jgi:hypothetical protein
MFFAAIGAIFLVAGVALSLNIKNAAERAFHLFAQFTPTVGTATPKTLRIVGTVWIPFGVFALAVGIFR